MFTQVDRHSLVVKRERSPRFPSQMDVIPDQAAYLPGGRVSPSESGVNNGRGGSTPEDCCEVSRE